MHPCKTTFCIFPASASFRMEVPNCPARMDFKVHPEVYSGRADKNCKKGAFPAPHFTDNFSVRFIKPASHQLVLHIRLNKFRKEWSGAQSSIYLSRQNIKTKVHDPFTHFICPRRLTFFLRRRPIKHHPKRWAIHDRPNQSCTSR